MTAVHVNRILQGLRQDRSADVRRNACIYDLDALVKAGDFKADDLQLDVKPQKRLSFALGQLTR